MIGDEEPDACHPLVIPDDGDMTDAGKAWAGITDPQQRRRLQNRVNQQAHRQRKASQRPAGTSARRGRKQPASEVQASLALRPLLPKTTNEAALIGSKESQKEQTQKCLTPAPSKSDGKAVRRGIQSGAITLNSIAYPLDSRLAMQPALNDAATRDMFDFSINHLLRVVGVRASTGDDLACVLARSALHDPGMFYGLLAGGAGQRSAITNNPKDTEAFIMAQSQTARAVREGLASGRYTDGLLFAIMCLSAQPNVYVHSISKEDRYPRAFQSPVKDIGGIQWMGLVDMAGEHTNVWVHLLKTKRPIYKINFPGVAESLQIADIFTASLHIRPPAMPLTRTYVELLDRASKTWRPPREEAKPFLVEGDLEDILLDMRACSQLLDSVVNKDASSPAVDYFVRYRHAIQHRLLQLSTGTLTICLLAAMIYSYAVLFPLPDPRPIKKLAKQLDLLLAEPPDDEAEKSKLRLWAAFMGGMGSGSGVLRDDFAANISSTARNLDLLHWADVVTILSDFLWHPGACNEGGLELWLHSSRVGSGGLNSRLDQVPAAKLRV